jgi:hypothetical protein
VSLTESLKVPSIREALLQFASVIRELTNQMEGDKEMKIIETIMSSKEILQSAIAIQNALPQIMKDFFCCLYKGFEKEGFDIERADEKSIDEYYINVKKSFPYFYIVLHKFSNDSFLSFNIDVYNNLYC